jgi:hypothetical protein
MAAIAGSTRSATSCSVVAVISSETASARRFCSGRRQAIRSRVGGVRPIRKASALTVTSRSPASAAAESSAVSGTETRSASVISMAAAARRRIRFRATLGCPRPARQRRAATTTVRTVQWKTNAAR